MKKTAGRIAGFVIILGGILLILQMMTMVTEKDRVMVGPGVEFKPEQPPAKKPELPEKKEHQALPKKAEKSPASLSEPKPVKVEKTDLKPEPDLKPGPDLKPDKSDKTTSDKLDPEPVAKPEDLVPEPLKVEKIPSQKNEPEPLKKTPDMINKEDKSLGKNGTGPEKADESPNKKPDKKSESPKSAHDVKPVATLRNTFPHESPEPIKNTKTPRVIALSEEEFIALDKARDNGPASFHKTEGIYGWGLVGNYEKPDTAVQTLGGTPFAIDEAGQYYYRISLSEGKVKAVTMVSAAYSTIGIEAHDPRLASLVKKAVRTGKVFTRPENLHYYYLFTKSTERYIIEKVALAFEWFISKSGYDPEKAEDFRRNARIRLDVWQARRPRGGEMGVAVPIYFDYKGEKIFLPDEYFQTDPESVRLALRIDRKEY